MNTKFSTVIALLTVLFFFINDHLNTLYSVKAENIEPIPQRMDPWTIIKYVEDNKYVIVKKGEPIPEGSALPESESSQLPRPLGKEGVSVEYGFNGEPTIIKGVKHGEEHPGKHFYHSGVVQPDARDGEIIKGKFSMYTGNKDERGFPIGNYVCATQQTLDNPPYGTTIIAMNLDNKKVAILKKRDVGLLRNDVVLDIRPYVFEKVLGVNRRAGWITNGAYYHD